MFLDAFSHPLRRSRSWRPSHLAALWPVGLVFALGLIAGTLMPRQGYKAGPVNGPFDRPRENAAAASRGGIAPGRKDVDVVRVIDGDTFEARVHLWPGLEMTTRVRLRGIDAPELKARCAEELRMAQNAGAALTALLAEGSVSIFNIGPDKYNGRVVADAATAQTPDVSAALLAAGHARAYRGGHRDGWCGSGRR